MTWRSIVDGAVEEWAPLTARLFAQLRDNYRAAADLHTLPPFDWSGSVLTDVYWETISSLRLFIPDRTIGGDGVRIGLYVEATYSAGGGGNNAYIRIDGPSVTGASQLVTPSAPFSGMLYLTEPGTITEAVHGLNLDGLIAHTTGRIDATPGRISLERVEL